MKQARSPSVISRILAVECLESDTSVLDDAHDFLQSSTWALQKTVFGWKSRTFSIKVGSDTLVLLVLLRKITGFYLAYIPHAPSLTMIESCVASGFSPAEVLVAIGHQLRHFLPASIFIRFDLNWKLHEDMDEQMTGLPDSSLVKAQANIQPADTVILNISASKYTEEDILSKMKSKTRYNIRLARKKGVRTELDRRSDFELPPHFDQWYSLYQFTAERNHISLHSKEYYAHLFSITRVSDCRLYLAHHEENLIAGIIVIRHARQGIYLYGASSDLKRDLMPAYALQWRAISDLRTEGLTSYDLFGIPPTSNPEHHMFGLYQFKTGFGGEIVHSPGSWDLPLRPMLYSLYRIIEVVRMYYFRVQKKRRLKRNS